MDDSRTCPHVGTFQRSWYYIMEDSLRQLSFVCLQRNIILHRYFQAHYPESNGAAVSAVQWKSLREYWGRTISFLLWFHTEQHPLKLSGEPSRDDDEKKWTWLARNIRFCLARFGWHSSSWCNLQGSHEKLVLPSLQYLPIDRNGSGKQSEDENWLKEKSWSTTGTAWKSFVRGWNAEWCVPQKHETLANYQWCLFTRCQHTVESWPVIIRTRHSKGPVLWLARSDKTATFRPRTYQTKPNPFETMCCQTKKIKFNTLKCLNCFEQHFFIKNLICLFKLWLSQFIFWYMKYDWTC